MHRLYIHSGSAILYHPQHVVTSMVAIYDRNLLRPFMEKFIFKGNPRDAEKAKFAFQVFLEQWDEGEDRICVEFGGINLSVCKMNYIEREKGMVELGTRPGNPYRDILCASYHLARSMELDRADCAKRYKDLQELLQKHPQLPAFKEKA